MPDEVPPKSSLPYYWRIWELKEYWDFHGLAETAATTVCKRS